MTDERGPYEAETRSFRYGTLDEKTRTTIGAAVGVVLVIIVPLTVWLVTLSNRVTEHDKQLESTARQVEALAKHQQELDEKLITGLNAIASDQGLLKERMQYQGEQLAEIKGSLRPAGAISLQQTSAPQPVRQRPPIGSFR